MRCAIMARLRGDLNEIAFDMHAVKRIMNLDSAQVVFSHEEDALLLKVDDHVCRVEVEMNGGGLSDYFIVLHSWQAVNVKAYKILFNVEDLPQERLTGTDESGKRHICRRYSPRIGNGPQPDPGDHEEERRSGAPAGEALNQGRMIARLTQEEFFEALTSEFSGKLKDIAQELIAFRRDLQNKIEPGIVSLAEKEIPEAGNQLEAINDTLESSTMRIMDIHEDQMEVASGCLGGLKALLGQGEDGISLGDAMAALQESLRALEKICALNLHMIEPLSFQDLVGQRIQKIIRLVKSMEGKIEDLVISFGIRLKRYKEDPSRSFEDLNLEVEEYKSELKGPQRVGEGMDQAAVDALLASL